MAQLSVAGAYLTVSCATFRLRHKYLWYCNKYNLS